MLIPDTQRLRLKSWSLPLLTFPPVASSAMAPKRIQREDRRAERDEEARRVRARLETHDDQIEGLGITARQHDLRLQYLESPFK